MARLMISDVLWAKIESHLRRAGAHLTFTTRRSMEGMLWRIRTGSPWRDLPVSFGPWQTVYNRFNRWAKAGICGEFFALAKSRELDAEWQAFDATIIRAHQHSAGARGHKDEAIGRSKGGRTTKVHALTDAHGNPTKIIISRGQDSDVTYAPQLLACIEESAGSVLGDKAYDSKNFRSAASARGVTVVIPFRATTLAGRDMGFDRELYRHRHIVENLFGRLKHFRAFATRYDKLARNFLALVHLACAFLWVKLA